MKRRMFEKKEFHKLSFVLELDCVQNRWLINHMLCLLFFTFTQQLWSRSAFRSEFTASRETETGKPKTWYFHNLVQFIVIHWLKFWLCQCHYLISCSLPNTRSCQPAKGSCCKNNLLPTLLGRILFVHLCFYHFSSNFWSFPLRVSHSQDLPTLSYGAALPFHPLYFPNRMLPEGEEKMGRGINQ